MPGEDEREGSAYPVPTSVLVVCLFRGEREGVLFCPCVPA